MALEGSLKDFGLADILQLIYFQRKTGVLTLEGRTDRVRLLFVDGNITGAESKRRIEDNRLGKILLKKGYIKDEDLNTALTEQKTTGTKLGNILIQKELVKKEIVYEILKSQINETVIQLFGWKQGTYEFVAQGVPRDKEFVFSLDTQHLLMEGMRIVDEWSQIKGKLTLDTVFIKKTDSPTQLSEDEHEIFSFVDGETDVSTIIDFSTKDNFQVSNTLLALMEKGVIEAVESVPAVEEPVVPQVKKLVPFVGSLPVLAFVAALILTLLVSFFQKNESYENFRASSDIQYLRFLVKTYRLEHDAYPHSLELISSSRDPWGKPYLYSTKGDSFELSSAGADGRSGTEDDVY